MNALTVTQRFFTAETRSRREINFSAALGGTSSRTQLGDRNHTASYRSTASLPGRYEPSETFA
ncbi:MAG: hypothetical protein DMG58_24750 [Acidobacteria bacterium]|nr:MAG: hypothetical protein DMG58_24750 [Acidobacteriota bacterium]